MDTPKDETETEIILTPLPGESPAEHARRAWALVAANPGATVTTVYEFDTTDLLAKYEQAREP